MIENAPEPSPESVDYVTVGRVDEVAEGEGKAFDLNGRSIAVFKVSGEIYAIENQCPHMGAPLATGFLDDCVVACAWHGWRFDVRDGTWCDNRRVKIDAFATRVKDGEIQVATLPMPKNPS